MFIEIILYFKKFKKNLFKNSILSSLMGARDAHMLMSLFGKRSNDSLSSIGSWLISNFFRAALSYIEIETLCPVGLIPCLVDDDSV